MDYFEGLMDEEVHRYGGPILSSDFTIKDHIKLRSGRAKPFKPKTYGKKKFERCPTCGNKVTMPCLYCSIND